MTKNKILSLFFAILLFAALSQTAGAVSIDIRHYDIHVVHDKADSVFRVNCMIEVSKAADIDTIGMYFTQFAELDSVVLSSPDGSVPTQSHFEWRVFKVIVPRNCTMTACYG